MLASELETIQAALKAWGRFTQSFKYGGLHAEWEQSKETIIAFERVKKAIEGGQLALPGLGSLTCEACGGKIE